MKVIQCFLLLIALSFTTVSNADSKSAKQVVIPESLQSAYDNMRFAPAIRAGDMLYLSGVVARVEQADEGDISKSIERAFDKIELILTEAGASWSHVVDVTSYMTDLDSQIDALWAVKQQRVFAPYPAWTAIGVSSLYGGPAAIIEIKVVAYMGEK